MLENPDTELANGRRITLAGENLDIRGTLIASGGDRFLIVNVPDSHVCALIAQGAAVEEAEAVSPEDAQAQREEEANRQADPQPAVTDAPDVTGPQDPSPADPQAPVPPTQ